MMVLPLHPIPPPPLARAAGVESGFTTMKPPKPRPDPYPPARVDASEREPRRDCEWLPKPEVVRSERKASTLLILEKDVSCVYLPEPPPPPAPERLRR